MPAQRIPRHAIILLATVGILAAVFRCPPIAQHPAYHRFADQRQWLGVPNGLNVLSNLPVAFVGLWGLGVTLGRGTSPTLPFSGRSERWAYPALYLARQSGSAFLVAAIVAYGAAKHSRRRINRSSSTWAWSVVTP